MPSGRTAGHADPVGVDVVLRGVGPQPANGRLDIVNGGGEGIFRSQPIGDGHGDIAVLGQAEAQAVVTLAIAGPEAAAVDAQDRREGTIALLRPGQVELKVLVVGVGVLDARS